ncbi:MAG: GGDEF domain-containing protein [Xanthobacteraceae bacterium]
MSLAAALIYWVIVVLWLTVLGTILVFYIRNPRVFGTTRLLLAVVAIDTLRNIVENIYFGLYFGSQYGLFSAAIGGTLGNPILLIVPKLINVAAGCLVLGLLLLRWLPSAIRERGQSEQDADDLKTLAAVDGLTGLYNRRHFELLARAEWIRFQRYFRPLSVLIIDVDHFKTVNDRFGHDEGDKVLKLIAIVCGSAKRESDAVARIGGEEFALLLPETNEAAALIIAERLLAQVRECVYPIGNENIGLTVSIGVASATPSMSGIETLIKRADDALYEAKRSGRDRVAIASASISSSEAFAAA